MKNNQNRRAGKWADRTLTVLRGARLEACAKELAGLGGCGLFDPETTDLEAERLFSQSFFAREEKKPRLHTIEEMRTQVLSQLPVEIGLLSEEEFILMLRLALVGGELPLLDWGDLPVARSLVYRMWCRMKPDRGLWIRMPRQICVAFLMMLTSEEMKKVRDIVQEALETADNTLYLAGMMPAEIVLRDLAFRLQGSLAADRPELYMRTLSTAYETVRTREGQLMLLHPGLAEPEMLPQTSSGFHPGVNQMTLEDLYGSLMDVEDPLYDRLLGLIADVTRPEINPEELVEDLILLAKQDAPEAEMNAVLSAKLSCLSTPEMEEAVREIHRRTPRWFTLNMERIQ